MNAQEIDKLFLNGECKNDENIIETISQYLENAKSYNNQLQSLDRESDDHLKLFQFYHLKLNSLSQELEEIEKKNDDIKTELRNKKNVYEELKSLLASIEIKEEHFSILDNPNFDNLGSIQISLGVLNSFYSDYDIRVVNERKERVRNTLKSFISSFFTYFQRVLNSFSTESKGELRIHSRIYDEIKKFDFIIDYCKENDKDGFIVLSRKYLSCVKFIYENEFEIHLRFVTKALRGFKKTLKAKMEELIAIVLESFFVVVKCENNFVRNVFYDEDDYANDFLKNMFREVVSIISDFLKDCSKINLLFCINAAYKSSNIKSDFEDFNLDLINNVREDIKILMNDFKNEYFKYCRYKMKTESKRKTFRNIMEDIKNNSNEEMNGDCIKFMINELNNLGRKDKGQIEFCFYKMILLDEIIRLDKNFHKEELLNVRNDLEKIYEKELIGYVFSGIEKGIKLRIENVLELLKEISKENELFKKNMTEFTREIILNNVEDKNKDLALKAFSKVK
ncbi:Exocyst complex component 1 [Gurleya vavrai]